MGRTREGAQKGESKAVLWAGSGCPGFHGHLLQPQPRWAGFPGGVWDPEASLRTQGRDGHHGTN